MGVGHQENVGSGYRSFKDDEFARGDGRKVEDINTVAQQSSRLSFLVCCDSRSLVVVVVVLWW